MSISDVTIFWANLLEIRLYISSNKNKVTGWVLLVYNTKKQLIKK